MVLLPLDSAVAETFFHTLMTELIYHPRYPTARRRGAESWSTSPRSATDAQPIYHSSDDHEARFVHLAGATSDWCTRLSGHILEDITKGTSLLPYVALL